MVEPLMACVITARSPFPWSAQACLRLDLRQLAAAKPFWLGIRAGAGRSKLRQMKAVASYRTPRIVERPLASIRILLPGHLRRAVKIDSQRRPAGPLSAQP